MAKIENEQVVNRFLLSTTYGIIAGLMLYFMYVRGIYSLWANTFYFGMFIMGIIGTVFFGIRKFGLKMGTGYHFCLFIVIAVMGAFLRFGSYIPVFFSAYNRIAATGILIAILYVFEIVHYFVFVNKDTAKR